MSQLSIVDQGAVRLVTITNPPRGYMNAQTASELLETIKRAETEDSVRVLVFTGGVPGVFIRHYDVGEIVAIAEAARAGKIQPGGDRTASPIYDLFDRMLVYPKPMIAAINGMCMGGGFEFALACDIRIAARTDMSIGLPETRLGIIPGVGGLQLLARVIGLSRATELVMRGRTVGPDDAFALGMVHYLADDVVAEAMRVAQELAQRPPVAIAATKRMAARIAAGESLPDGLITASREFFHTLVTGDDALIHMQRFLDTGEDIEAD